MRGLLVMTTSFQLTIINDQLSMNYQLPITNLKTINAKHLPQLKIVNCKLKIEPTLGGLL